MLLNWAETLARTPCSRNGGSQKRHRKCFKKHRFWAPPGTKNTEKLGKVTPWKIVKNHDPKIWCKVFPRPQNRTTFSSRKSTRNHTDSQNPQNGDRGWPRPPKMTKNMVWSLRNLEKQHPKPIENLENAAPKFPRNLDLAKARWRVMRAAHWI